MSYGGATTYGPVIEPLRGYFKIVDGDDARAVRVRVTGPDPAMQDTLPGVLA